MTVQIKDTAAKDKESVVATTDTAQESDAPKETQVVLVDLELTACERFVLFGELYEKGRAYAFTEADASNMLRVRMEDGTPVFARYVAPEDKDVRIIRQAPKPVSRPVVQKVVASAEAPKVTRIDVGDDSELSDVLTDKDEDEVEL